MVGGDPDHRERLIRRASTLASLDLVYAEGSAAMFAKEAIRLDVDRDGPTTVVVGRVFDASGQAVKPSLRGMMSATQGPLRYMIERHWGEWLCILHDTDKDSWRLGRDPSGGIGCYYLSSEGCLIAASHVRDLFLVSGQRPDIYWPSIVAQLSRPAHRTAYTGLENVRELLPGFSLTVGNDGVAQCEEVIWSPWDHTRPRPQFDFEDILPRTIDRVVKAYVRCFANPILALSGGLDSSVVAASLAQAGARFSAFSFVDRSREGDESSYARSVCDALHAPLTSILYEEDKIDLLRTDSESLPRPTARIHNQSVDQSRNILAGTAGGSAIFSGDGGDNLFCLLQSAAPVLDRMRSDDIHGSVRQTLFDIAALTGVSVPKVALAACTKLLRGNAYRWPENQLFLTNRGKQIARSQSWHPWLAPPRTALPGKVAHVALMVRTHSYREAYHSPETTIVMPFLAQPLAELCLSVPSWKWSEGGRNRMPVRRAYSQRLPRNIIERRTKGGPDGHCIRLVNGNRNLLRDLLLAGRLADKGFVERSSIEACLSTPEIPGPACHRLLALAETEAWAAAWSGSSPD